MKLLDFGPWNPTMESVNRRGIHISKCLSEENKKAQTSNSDSQPQSQESAVMELSWQKMIEESQGAQLLFSVSHENVVLTCFVVFLSLIGK